MKKKMLSLCLALMLILSANMILLISAAPAGRVYVDPPSIKFSTDSTQPNYRAVGDNFTVNINAADFVAPGVYAYELKLFYDNTSIECVAWEFPAGHFLTPAAGELPIGIVPQMYEIAGNHAKGYALAAIYLQGEAAGKTGSGVLITFTFKITKAPPAAGKLSCDLVLGDVIFADPDINTIEVTAVNGYYEYAAPMPPFPYLKVEPEFVSTKELGDQFNINITIKELVADWKAVGFQWKLIFSTTILRILNITEGDFLLKQLPPEYGTYFYALQEADYVISFSLWWESPWPPEVFPAGSGTLATIKFNATSVGSCNLTLTDVLIVDVNTNQIETRPHQSGKYAFAPPWLSLAPKEYTANELNELFDISVLINDVSSAWRMVGAEFKIRYNMTLLDLVNITEGGFMKYFAMLSGTPAPYTWFQYYVEEDPVSKYGIVGIMIYPLENGTWPGPFPDTGDYGGPGDLAIVTFKAIKQWDEIDVTDEKAIWLDEIILANTEAMEIPYDEAKTAAEGKCKYTITKKIPPFAGFLDLMTQYPDSWNGKNKDAASDAFPPQGVVELRGLVTYQGDVVPGKPVSYAIKAPTGASYFGTNFTQADGIAVFAYSLPSSEEYFGLWTVEASVDLAGTIISDKLYFLMGWLIQVTEIQAPAEAYKGETMNINVTLTRICMQDPRDIMNMLLRDSAGKSILNNDLLLHITVTDELKQLVASSTLNTSMITEISDIDLNEFVKTIGNSWNDRIAIISTDYPTLTRIVMNGIPISAAAFSGNATIHANVLTDLPGVAYCPEGITKVWIKKRT